MMCPLGLVLVWSPFLETKGEVEDIPYLGAMMLC
jgi:hypothetical protein